MSDRNQPDDTGRTSSTNEMSGKGHGRQGVDKAPGEETAQDTKNIVQDTQKGKNKVDGDQSRESDRPVEKE